MVCKFLIISQRFIYLNSTNRKLQLFSYPDLKLFLSAKEIDKKVEVCRLVNDEVVYAVYVKEDLSKNLICKKYLYKEDINWPAYYAVTIYCIKNQLTSLVFNSEEKATKELVCSILGKIEPFCAKGLPYKSWLEGEKKDEAQ